MKKFQYTCLTIFSMLLMVCSCEDKLDFTPQDQISSSTFWTTPNDALMALNGCYSYMDEAADNGYWDGAGDNAFCQYPWESYATIIASGDISPLTIENGYPGDNSYNPRYQGIRRFNYFLANVDNVPGLDSKLKARYISEVRFLRAFVYFKLAAFFGPVPLLKEMYDKLTEAAIAPSPAADVIAYAIAELKDISENNTLVGSYETGRVTLGTALALKARVELYSGKYPDAAATAKKIMEMGTYSLFRKASLNAEDMAVDYSNLVTFADDADKESFYMGLSSYEQQFWAENDNNPEVILARQYIPNTSWDYGNYMNTMYLPTQWGGWASVTPTQGLIDAYWNRDGSPSNPPSAANRQAYYNNGEPTAQYLDEFKNRDTRLYASMLFSGAQINSPGGVLEYQWSDEKSDNKIGYSCRKTVDLFSDPGDGAGAQDFPLFRYAEVLLTFAEAQNETGGPSADVYAALNDIRDRAGMPDVDQAAYNTKETLRELIRNERRIELAMEGQRYYDIRRWGIAGTVMKNEYAVDGGLAQARVWKDIYVLMPYPQSAVDHNPNLASSQKSKGY